MAVYLQQNQVNIFVRITYVSVSVLFYVVVLKRTGAWVISLSVRLIFQFKQGMLHQNRKKKSPGVSPEENLQGIKAK